jgi:hypothetical protein
MGSVNKLRPTNREEYLSGLPEEIYSKKRSTHMVRIMDALCGGAGVEAARNHLMLKRLQTSLDETHYNDIDEFYGRVLGFRRLESESYPFDPRTRLLTKEQEDEADAKDARYRARIHKYVTAFQYGGTAYGIRLASESACGKPCKVLEAWRFYESVNVDDGDQASLRPGHYAQANYNEYVVVVDADEVTDAERYNINKVTKRIRPQDAVITVVQRDDFFDSLILETSADADVEIANVAASSSLWQVKRFVTGRPDWEYDVDDDLNLWVSPNERREAPTQALVNHQEDTFDFTYAVEDATASTEHVGAYDVRHTNAFRSLDTSERTDLQKASNAVSDVASRLYTASYYGADGMVDWSYPVQYAPLVQSKFSEEARSSRIWSSDEAYPADRPEEWFEVRLQRGVPVNRIEFEVSKKPIEVVPYVLVDVEGDVWLPLTSSFGTELSYTSRSWGGASVTGDMASVTFKFNLAQAYGFRLVFKRLDVPYYRTLSDGALKQEDFPFSIDMSGFALHYDINRVEDFAPATFQDPFGNKVDTELRVSGPEMLHDGSFSTFWCSKPNVSQSAVEWLVFDVRDDGAPVRLNGMMVEAVYGGAQMNVYSTEDDDWETASWKPYPTVYTLQSADYSLPLRKCSFVKLEFTGLQAVPYTVVSDGIEVEELDYPYEIKHYFENQPASTYATELYRQLLSTQDSPVYEDTLGVYDAIGTSNIYKEAERQRDIADIISQSYNPLYLPSLVTPSSWRFTDNGAISSVLAENMRYEKQLPTSPRTPVEGKTVRTRFYEDGPHSYKTVRRTRSDEIAYVAAIREVRFGLTGLRAAVEPDSEFLAFVNDGSVIERNNGFELTRDERMVPSTEEMNSLEFVNVNSAVAFKSFDFAVNQNPPREVFDYPSDMSREWEGLNSQTSRTEFGVSGTVLKMDAPDSGPGVNLLKFTENMPISSTLNGPDGISTYSPYEKIEDTGQGLKLTFGGNNNASMSVPLAFPGCIADGEKVTLSFEYRGNIDRFGWFCLLQQTAPNVVTRMKDPEAISATEWSRYEWTFSIANANVRTNYQALLFYGLGSYASSSWVEIRKGTLKLESGDAATPYSPAPGDGGPVGIQSESKLVRAQSIASVQIDVFSVEARSWNLRCKDLADEEVFNMKYEVEGGKWTTIGTVFTPQTGGMWWSNAYDYRVRIPLEGFVPVGTTVFVPNIDFSILRAQTEPMVRQDLKDFRVVYYNGVETKEIDCDITDNMELWFRVQDEVPAGKKAEGYYDYELNQFVGAYYVYFGNPNETRQPMRDWHKVFKPVERPCYEMSVIDPAGTISYEAGKGARIVDAEASLQIEEAFRIDAGAGFLTFEYTPDEGLERVPSGQRGTAAERYFIDYMDESRRFSVYSYEQQLFVRIEEPDGFVNSFVTKDPAPFEAGVKSYVLIQWGEQGTEPVHSAPGRIDPNDKSRRSMDVWIDGVQCECINNVYNEAVYNNGVY